MLDQVPDTIKVGASLSAPVLTILGVSIEDWTYIFSAIVSILFIIEKLPIVITRFKTFVKWIKNLYESQK